MPNTFPEPRRRVAVTALGVVSPLGLGLAETLEALRTGRDGVTPVTRFDVSRNRAKTAGQIPARWEVEWDVEYAASSRHQLHPASHMLSAAVREAVAGDPDFQPEYMIIGTTSGGMSFGEAFYRGQIARTRLRERAGWLANYLPQKAVVDAQAAGGFSVPVQIIANACASGSNAIGHAWTLISTGQKARVLCGGYDAIAEMVFAGFDSLQASTPEKIRPFDKDRTGLVLGEGAGVLTLEEWDSAKRRGAPIVAELTGYGISTDNFHLTQPNPSGIGPRLAMERALGSARRRPEEVSYVNAHGTATQFNDATEGAAIHQLFGEHTPVSSTKSMMGHALGAAGAIEAVFSVLALQHQFLPPNINLTQVDPAWRLDIVANEAREANVRCVVSNSFGFGGTNASIVLERAES
jgi:3-oxoacyl-[acyl-carrier-protein] synthase II